MTTKRLRIEGLVQGVGFRWSMSCEAQALGLAGWVRNRREGWVEAIVRGEDIAIATIIAWSKRGPPQARVDRLTVESDEALEQEILPKLFTEYPTL